MNLHSRILPTSYYLRSRVMPNPSLHRLLCTNRLSHITSDVTATVQLEVREIQNRLFRCRVLQLNRSICVHFSCQASGWCVCVSAVNEAPGLRFDEFVFINIDDVIGALTFLLFNFQVYLIQQNVLNVFLSILYISYYYYFFNALNMPYSIGLYLP